MRKKKMKKENIIILENYINDLVNTNIEEDNARKVFNHCLLDIINDLENNNIYDAFNYANNMLDSVCIYNWQEWAILSEFTTDIINVNWDNAWDSAIYELYEIVKDIKEYYNELKEEEEEEEEE